MKQSLFVSAFIVAIASAATSFAQTPSPTPVIEYPGYLFVDYSSGNDSNWGRTTETAFKSLQHAVTVVQAGENIVLKGGDWTYTTEGSYPGTILGADWGASASSSPILIASDTEGVWWSDSTIASIYLIIYCPSNVPVDFSYLKFMRSQVRFYSDDCSIDHCDFRDNAFNDQTEDIITLLVYGDDFSADWCTFSGVSDRLHCFSKNGAVTIMSGAENSSFENCEFINCLTMPHEVWGFPKYGAICYKYVSGSHSISQCTFSGDRQLVGIWACLVDSDADVSITRNRFHDFVVGEGLVTISSSKGNYQINANIFDQLSADELVRPICTSNGVNLDFFNNTVAEVDVSSIFNLDRVTSADDFRIYNNCFYVSEYNRFLYMTFIAQTDPEIFHGVGNYRYNAYPKIEDSNLAPFMVFFEDPQLNPKFCQNTLYEPQQISPLLYLGNDNPSYQAAKDYLGRSYAGTEAIGAYSDWGCVPSPTPVGYKTPYPGGPTPPTPAPTATSFQAETPSPTATIYPSRTPTSTPIDIQTPTPITPPPTPPPPTPPNVFFRVRTSDPDVYIRVFRERYIGAITDFYAGTDQWIDISVPPSESMTWYVAQFARKNSYVNGDWKRYSNNTFQVLEWEIEWPSPSPTVTPTPSPSPSPIPTATPYHVIVDWDDYNGDGTTDIAMYRPGTFEWLIKNYTSFTFGTDNCIPAPGDYDGDGCADAAYFSKGEWYVNAITSGVDWGELGDLPVPADYNGDGTTEIAVYRPSTGYWYIRGITLSLFGGGNTDFPVPGDYDGDGTADLAYFSAGAASIWHTSVGNTTWGVQSDIPVPMDYDGDGTTNYIVWREAITRWLIKDITNFSYGLSGDMPLCGDFDGDGMVESAIWRPASTRWFIRYQDASTESSKFGASTDIPTVGASY